MIGFFANQLNSVVGSVLFTLGVVMLVISIVLITMQGFGVQKVDFSKSAYTTEEIAIQEFRKRRNILG